MEKPRGRSAGFFNEPENRPGVMIIQDEKEATQTGERQQRTWHWVDDGSTPYRVENGSDVAVTTVTWASFAALTSALLAVLGRLALALGASQGSIIIAAVVTGVILFGLFCYFISSRPPKYAYWQLSSIIAGFLLVAL